MSIDIEVEYSGQSTDEYRRLWLIEWAKQDPEDRHNEILAVLSDLIGGFFYYDRKEDDSLQVGAIEWSIENGDIKENGE